MSLKEENKMQISHDEHTKWISNYNVRVDYSCLNYRMLENGCTRSCFYCSKDLKKNLVR